MMPLNLQYKIEYHTEVSGTKSIVHLSYANNYVNHLYKAKLICIFNI